MALRIRSLTPCAAFLLFSFVVRAGPVVADPLIARAQHLAAAGENESASRLYRSWLDLNPGATGSARVFSRYFHLEGDVPALLDSCDRFLSTNHATAGEQLLLIARFFELAGRLEGARSAYLDAYAATGAETALLSSALLSLEMNDIDALAKSRETLRGKSGRFDSLLDALTALQRGDNASARSTLLAVADDAGSKDLSLRALWILFSNAATSGDQKAMAEARRRMTSGFSGAPETILATGGSPTATGRPTVVLLPRPDLPPGGLDLPAPDAAGSPEATTPMAPLPPASAPSAQAPPVSTPQPGSTADQAAPSPLPSVPTATATAPSVARMAVQAGSFQVRENADDLVADLLKVGFHPTVREETNPGVVRYRVFAGTGLGVDEAKQLLSKLVQAGFSGFLVAEK